MAALGHDRFAVAGHDRGGRVAYRMALDHPDRVRAAAVLDVVPTGEVWARADAAIALGLLALGVPRPARAAARAPDRRRPRRVLRPPRPARSASAARRAATRRSWWRPTAPCSTTRARSRRSARTTAPGPAIDRDHDDADRGRRRIECPLLALWSAHGALPRFYGDVLDVWRPWARQITGRGLDASHFLVEDQPEQVAVLLSDFLQRSVAAAPSIP